MGHNVELILKYAGAFLIGAFTLGGLVSMVKSKLERSKETGEKVDKLIETVAKHDTEIKVNKTAMVGIDNRLESMEEMLGTIQGILMDRRQV